MALATHNGVYAVPFVTEGTEDEIRVYAHDSGQRYHWSYAPEGATNDCNRWLEHHIQNGLPTECVGTVNLIPLKWITEADEYVGQ